MLLELRHHVSKTASNEFWSTAVKLLPKLTEAKRIAESRKKIPKFRSIRDKIYKENVPEISLEVAYEHKETGDIIILQDLEKTPVSKFPPSTYKKLYETVRVKVSERVAIVVMCTGFFQHNCTHAMTRKPK